MPQPEPCSRGNPNNRSPPNPHGMGSTVRQVRKAAHHAREVDDFEVFGPGDHPVLQVVGASVDFIRLTHCCAAAGMHGRPIGAYCSRYSPAATATGSVQFACNTDPRPGLPHISVRKAHSSYRPFCSVPHAGRGNIREGEKRRPGFANNSFASSTPAIHDFRCAALS